MADPRGFLTAGRETPTRRPVALRLQDWREVYEDFPLGTLKTQASRCMDCGIPFCHSQCPLGNIIPEWNDLAWRDDWKTASERLHATNNFPEFTGRLCPAPCEAACVLGINQDPVAIKQIEVTIVEKAWESGWIEAKAPDRLSGKTVAVIGSGPAGLTCAAELAKRGYKVTIFEALHAVGGVLRYGIPEFRLPRYILDLETERIRELGVEIIQHCRVTGIDREARTVLLAGGERRWIALVSALVVCLILPIDGYAAAVLVVGPACVLTHATAGIS